MLKVASNTIKIPDNVLEQLHNSINSYYDRYNKYLNSEKERFKPLLLDVFSFDNPMSNEHNDVRLYFEKDYSKSPLAYYKTKDGDVSRNSIVVNAIDEISKAQLYELIYHELIHAIDIKSNKMYEKFVQPFDDKYKDFFNSNSEHTAEFLTDYYNLETEFDAFSAQIILSIRNNITNKEKSVYIDDLNNFLTSDSTTLMTSLVRNERSRLSFNKFLFFLTERNLRRFKIKLYNEIFNKFGLSNED